jgi:hypothetical protein
VRITGLSEPQLRENETTLSENRSITSGFDQINESIIEERFPLPAVRFAIPGFGQGQVGRAGTI